MPTTLDTSTLAWTATVVWDWRYVFNLLYRHPSCLQCGDCTFPTGTWPLNSYFNFLHTALSGLLSRLLSGNLARERSTFAGALETTCSSARPAKGITLGISNGHRGVVKGGLDVGYRNGNVSSGFSSLIDLGRHYSVSQILVKTLITIVAELSML